MSLLMDALNKAEQTKEALNLKQEEGSLEAVSPIIEDQDRTNVVNWADEVPILLDKDEITIDKSAVTEIDVFPPVPQLSSVDELLAMGENNNTLDLDKISDKKTTELPAFAFNLELEKKTAINTNHALIENKTLVLPTLSDLNINDDLPVISAIPTLSPIPEPYFPNVSETLAAVEKQALIDENDNEIDTLLIHNPLRNKLGHKSLYLILSSLFTVALFIGYYVYIEITDLTGSQFNTVIKTPIATLQKQQQALTTTQEPINSTSVIAEQVKAVSTPIVIKTIIQEELVKKIDAMMDLANKTLLKTLASTQYIAESMNLLDKKTPEFQARNTIQPDKPEIINSSKQAYITVHSIDNNANVELSNNLLKLAYTAYLEKEDNLAQTYYKQILLINADNYDALLGMATVSVRLNKIKQAQKYYQHLLTNKPDDMYAEMGLIYINQQSNTETEWQNKIVNIKKRIIYNSSSANFYNILGSLYMEKKHWEMAREAYFQAYRYSSQNPNYSFDLAISLEKLKHSDAALRYYQISKGLAVDGQPIKFTLSALTKAIHRLENLHQ